MDGYDHSYMDENHQLELSMHNENLVIYSDTRDDYKESFELVTAAVENVPISAPKLKNLDPKIEVFKNPSYAICYRNQDVLNSVTKWLGILEEKRMKLQRCCYTGRVVVGPRGGSKIIFWKNEAEIEAVIGSI